jgi:hypothetical protein
LSLIEIIRIGYNIWERFHKKKMRVKKKLKKFLQKENKKI